MISTDNPENTISISSAASIMIDRDTSVHAATTGFATEPLKLQAPPCRWRRGVDGGGHGKSASEPLRLVREYHLAYERQSSERGKSRGLG